MSERGEARVRKDALLEVLARDEAQDKLAAAIGDERKGDAVRVEEGLELFERRVGRDDCSAAESVSGSPRPPRPGMHAPVYACVFFGKLRSASVLSWLSGASSAVLPASTSRFSSAMPTQPSSERVAGFEMGRMLYVGSSASLVLSCQPV